MSTQQRHRNVPTNRDDVIDSRDIDSRIEELEGSETAVEDAKTEHAEALEVLANATNELANCPLADSQGLEYAESAAEAAQEAVTNAHDAVQEAIREFDFDEQEELKQLLRFKGELEGYCDWQHGATLIRDDYLEEYAKELADDIGAIDTNAKWPLNHIDWEAAAEELKQDYTGGEFDGVTYWVR